MSPRWRPTIEVRDTLAEDGGLFIIKNFDRHGTDVSANGPLALNFRTIPLRTRISLGQ